MDQPYFTMSLCSVRNLASLVAVQKAGKKIVNWRTETRGRFYEDTDKRDVATKNWCSEVTSMTGQEWRSLLEPQEDFEKHDYYDFGEPLKHLPSPIWLNRLSHNS